LHAHPDTRPDNRLGPGLHRGGDTVALSRSRLPEPLRRVERDLRSWPWNWSGSSSVTRAGKIYLPRRGERTMAARVGIFRRA
jgi:hypothetical protein